MAKLISDALRSLEAGRWGMWGTAVLSAMLFLMSGCATYPAPKIDGNRYINYEYLYTLDLPDGWQSLHENDFNFDIFRSHTNLPFNGLLIGNGQNNAFLITTTIKFNNISWHDLKKKSIDWVKCGLAEVSEKMENDWQVTALRTEPENLKKTHRNWIENPDEFSARVLLEADLRPKDPDDCLRCRFSFLLYPCPYPDTCALFLALVSNPCQFDTESPAYEALTGSVRVFGDRALMPGM